MNQDPTFFREALIRHPDAVAELSANTFWRYVNGELPKSIVWMLRHPALLRALADCADSQPVATATTPTNDSLEIAHKA